VNIKLKPWLYSKETVFLLPGYSAHLLLRGCTGTPAIHTAIPLATPLLGKQALDFMFYKKRNCSVRTGTRSNNLTY